MDPNRQYTATDLRQMGLNPDQLWNGSQYNGYTVKDNGNGTRSFAPSNTNMGTSSYGGSNGGNNSGFNTGGWQDLLNRQKSEEDAFNKSYSDKVNSQESVSSMWDRLGQQYNLPTLMKSANDLTNTLASMPQTQANATRGFDVSEAQLQKIIADQTNKLAPLAQRATSEAQNAQNLTNQGIGYGLQEEQRQLQPFEMQSKLLADRMAREFTGYTTEKQQQLDMYLEQMREGNQLSLQQMQNAAALARQENDHQFQSQQLQQQFANQKELMPLQTNENIRQYNATTGRNSGAGSNYDIAAQLNALRMQNGKGATSYTGAKQTAQAPSYFKPVSQPTAQNQGILSNIGSFFKNLFS